VQREPKYAANERERDERDEEGERDENLCADGCDQSEQEAKQDVEGDFAGLGCDERAKTTERGGNVEVFEREEWKSKIAQENISCADDQDHQKSDAKEERDVREEGGGGRRSAGRHALDHAEDDGTKCGDKYESKGEEEQNFEA
jgi:hypothetical protein